MKKLQDDIQGLQAFRGFRSFFHVVLLLTQSMRGWFALVVLTAWVVASLVSLVWTPYPLQYLDSYHAWQSPSFSHWLGLDGNGADIASWLMVGARTDLLLVFYTVLFTLLLGVLLLFVMLACGSFMLNVTTVIVDAAISIPTVLLALILSISFGSSLSVIVVACGISYALNMVRIAKSRAVLIANSGFVQVAYAHGVSYARVFFRHILPNIASLLWVQLTLCAGTVILAEASLTYLGVGVPIGIPSWGRSLVTSVQYVSVNPLAALWPGLIVTIVVLAISIVGDICAGADKS